MEGLHALVCRFLAPVARFCLRKGMSVQEVSELLKQTLVHEAVHAMQAEGTKVTVSAISVRTGIRRREVDRIYNHAEVKEAPPSVMARVVGAWMQDERFQTKSGRPRVLTYEAEGGEFVDLVHSVSQDIHPGIVLENLLRAGTASESTRGIKLEKAFFLGSRNPGEAYNMLAGDMNRLMECVEENIAADNEPLNLHGTTFYLNVQSKHVQKIRDWMIDQGSAFHKKIRKQLEQYDSADRSKDDSAPTSQIYLTTFSHVSPNDVDQPSDPSDQ